MASTSNPVKVTDTLTVSCSDPTFVTPQFRKLTLTCEYDGDFNVPDVLYDCRAGTSGLGVVGVRGNRD